MNPNKTRGKGDQVKLILLAFLIVLAGLMFISPSETKADRREIAAAMRREAAAIQLAGYTCDSMDYMGEMLTARGYRVQCNGYRYTYAIADEGRRIVVRLGK